MMMGGRVIQANLHHCRAATDLLVQDMLQSRSQVVALVQEPYINADGIPSGIPGGLDCYYQAPGCRAAILGKDCNLLLCPRYSGRDIVTCQITMSSQRELYIVSVYADIQLPHLPEELDQLLGERGDCDIIISMDANAHSPMWGSLASNSRGDMMEEYIFQHNLVICNRGSVPTFVARGSATIVDVTLCSRSMIDDIKGWKVDKRDQMSDHRRISFGLNMEPPTRAPIWVTKRADWPRFSDLMRKKSELFQPHKYWTPVTLDREVKILHEDLRDCMSKVCPKTLVRRKRRNPWWSDELSLQRREVRHLQQKVMKDRENFPLWVHYKETRNKFCSAIRKAKRQSWKTFTEKTDSIEEMVKVSKAVLKQRTPKLGHLLKPDGNFTQNKGEILDTLLDAFFPGSTELGKESCSPPETVLKYEIRNLITPLKLEQAFKSFKKEKAPGPDGIKPVVLQNLDRTSLERLAMLCNVSLSLGYVPGRWRGAKAVLIPKVGKKDYSSPRSFRPISLTSFLFKGMERVVAWHLEEAGVTDKLSQHQHAFRKGKSTDTCLSEVVDNIESSILRNQYALGVFFDIEGAFDNVMTSKVLKGLNDKGVPQNIIKWYGQYLSNRSVTISLGNTTKSRLLTRGTPQGGILSPLVWNVVFDSLLTRLGNLPGVHPTGYADDGMFLITGIDPNTLFNLAQPAIDLAVAWGQENGLTFSHKKTQVILFKRKNKSKVECNLHMYGHKLPISIEISYLGLTMMERLNWNPHVTNKINKSKRKLCMLRAALGVTWGPSPRMLLWAFQSLIVPSLTYGSVIWAHRDLNKSILGKLSQLNRLAAIMTSPIRKSTPTAGLEVILGLKPIDLVAQELGLTSSLRLKTNPKWDGLGRNNKFLGHVRSWERRRGTLGLSEEGYDRAGLRLFNWDPPCTRTSDLNEVGALICTIQTEGEGDFLRFHSNFEGGNLGGEVTHRCVIKGQNPYRLYKGFELIIGAIDRLADEGMEVVILSEHCPVTLLRPIVNDTKTNTLLLAMSKLEMKVKGKIKFSNNKLLLEKHLPKQQWDGIRWDNVQVTTALRSWQIAKQAVKKWGDRKWQKRWDHLSTCSQTKIWFPILREDVTPMVKRLARADLGRFIQFTTGHNHLLRHRNLLEEGGGDKCRLCGLEREDSLHLWDVCQGTSSLRGGGTFQVYTPLPGQ